MCTGIGAAAGWIREANPFGQRVHMVIEARSLGLEDVALGSIAATAVCLTVAALDGDAFSVDVSPETIACTVGFEPGAAVSLEKAMRLSDRLGGHLVTGHVD